MKRLLVARLEAACGLLDRVWVGHPHTLARWSSDLDRRWHTGVWTSSPGEWDPSHHE